MLALIGGCGLPTSQASSATTTTPIPTAVQGVMPNFVGVLAVNAVNQLRAQFGPGMSIQASDGAASTYLPVTSQIPSAGALVTASTPVVLFTAAPAPTTTTSPTPTTTTTTEAPTSTEAPTTTYEDYDTPDPDVPAAPKRRSGHSGHPCLPGERDGDGDGYCGEGR